MNYFKLFIFFTIIFSFSITAHAQSVAEIQSKIEDRNAAIQRLEAEISEYQKELQGLAKEKTSLSNTIKSLDLSKKKLETDIKVTENKIAATNLEIQELSYQIGDKAERISEGKRVISQSLYTISQMDSSTIITNLLAQESFSDLWSKTDELAILQGSMQDRIESLANLKVNLEGNKKLTEKKKAELVSLTSELRDQKKVIEIAVNEKNELLDETKNSEASYNALLATKKQQKEAFEKELLAFEAALKIAVDPSSIPSAGAGVLKYPLDNVRITQYFGNTSFSTKNPQIYNGKGHTGVDFGASIGTPIKAAMGGIIAGVGNTDAVRGCLSYGKWIMVKHPNGLSTLYAHLSLQNVTQGQSVVTGEIIGYSGNTGYSTGPHLHFGVYATEGVRIQKFETSVNCKNVVIPFADLKAYLNPLSFL